jgi:acyl carrier protein
MTTASLFDRYEALLRTNIGRNAPDRLSPTDRLVDLGLGNSLLLVQLIVQIEETFQIDMPDEILTADAFESVDSLWSALRAVLERAG